ncbi:unnamed protein product [Discula destructiva]
MFRRRWSGLPDDPDFPADLEKLGYFVNDQDEIRSIKDPKYYFDYFHSKSMRHNDRQRFAFNLAVQDLIHERLTSSPSLSLIKLALPLGTPSTSPHTPIFVSPDLKRKNRIIVLFGESDQDLGVLAHRVVSGKGGVDAGSVVGLVKALTNNNNNNNNHNGRPEGDDVGVVLANMGESFWWPEGGRALSYRQSSGVRMKSTVHKGVYFDVQTHGIPGHGDVDEHVRMVFESVLGNADFLGEEAVIQVIGVSEGAVAVEKFLDENWTVWKDRVVSLAILGGGMEQDEVQNEGFKAFLKEKARAYICCATPLNTPMANPGGNPLAHYCTTTGTPVLSSGEYFYSELTLVKAQGAVLAWMHEVYNTAANRGRTYKNPMLAVTFRSDEYEESLDFCDRPAFEGFPARLPPPPNVLGIMDEAQPEEEAVHEEESVVGEAEAAGEEKPEEGLDAKGIGHKAQSQKVLVRGKEWECGCTRPCWFSGAPDADRVDEAAGEALEENDEKAFI